MGQKIIRPLAKVVLTPPQPPLGKGGENA